MLMLTLQATASPYPESTAPPGISGMASTYVPMDSWVYPAFERLAAEGYLPTAFFSLIPWTRNDCARLTEDAGEQLIDLPARSDTAQLLESLKEEFAPELARSWGTDHSEILLESLDQRVTVIAGRPLTDGFHFAATNTDDEGRPFGQRVNLYSGISVRASAGHFAGYIRTEFQRVPFAPVPGQFAQQQIAAADFATSAAGGPISVFARGRVLDANASFAFAGNQFTVGRQTLWWAQPGAALLSSAITPSQLACCVTIACALSLCQFFPGCSARCACNSSSDVWLTNSLFSNVCSCCDSYAARSRERHVPTQKSAKPDGRRDGSESQSSTCLRGSKGRLPLFWPSRTRNGCQKIGRIDDFLRN